MDKISVIVKAPGEKTGHMETIDNTLRALQELAGGPIEMLCQKTGRTKTKVIEMAVLQFLEKYKDEE